jgi:lipopolysaccharide/colanic/teichoic acid biosynthesis glycosyltransferase
MTSFKFISIKRLLGGWDFSTAVMAPVLALFLRYGWTTPERLTASFAFYVAFSLIGTMTMLRLSGVSNAAWRFFSFRDAIDAFSSIGFGVILAVGTSFFHDRLDGIPRILPFLQIFLQFFAYTGARFILKRLANHLRPPLARPANVLLIGCNQTSYIYARAVESIGQRSIQIIGALTHDPSMVGHTLRGIRIVATFDRIEEVIGTFKIHGMSVRKLILSANDAEISSRALERVRAASERFHLPLIDIHALFTEGTAFIDDQHEFSVEAIELRGSYWLIKRVLDASTAAALLIISAPVLFAGALVVTLDVGFPVVFWQERPGKHGRPIHVYKLRTMRDALDEHGGRLSDDERTSKLGHFLRKTRLDELPQLWNILRGDMSFIGPRPLLLVDQPEEMSQRLAARPGVSGWAQVNGGRIISPEEKRALDLWYIAHASFWLDIKTIWKTLVMIVKGDRRNEAEIRRALNWLVVQGPDLEEANLSSVPMNSPDASRERSPEQARDLTSGAFLSSQERPRLSKGPE